MHESSRLSNGLQVLTVTMPHVQSATIGIFTRVGSRFESDTHAGASHFIEHMLFKGTPRRPTPREIAEAIEGRGGVFNASTGLEATLYWAKVAATYVPEALDVISEMILHSKFDPEDIETERGVIAEEIKYALDAPDSLVQLRVAELQWPEHPLGRDIAGSIQSVDGLSREALLDYMAAHYHPGDTVLALAGLVEHSQSLAWAKEYLSEWEPGPPATYEPAPSNHDGPRLHLEARDTEQVHLSFSFTGLSRADPDRFVLRLLNVILGEGMRSRLFQEIRERLGLAYSIDSYVSTLLDCGSIGIYAGVATASAEKAITAILDQLDRFRQELVPTDELNKAREFTKGRLALALEDSFSVASWYARQEILGPEVLAPEDVLAHLDAIRPTDIQRLAQDLLQEEQLNLAAVGPFAGGRDRLSQVAHF
jgi:predicted Zn-dependent peptidase